MIEELIFGILLLVIICCTYEVGYCRGKLNGYGDCEKLYSSLEDQLKIWIDYYKKLASLRLNILLDNKIEVSDEWREKEEKILKEAEERNKKKD